MGRWKQKWYHALGRMKREVGEATGDRQVEARGAAQEAAGRPPNNRAVDRMLDVTRREHHDIEPVRAPDPER